MDVPTYARAVSRSPLTLALALALSAVWTTGAAAQDAGAVPVERRRLTLAMVLRAAGQSHPLTLAAEGRLRAARGERTTAGVFANPVLTYQVENASFPGGAPPAGVQREASTFTTLPLDQLWQRGSRVGRANGAVEAAQANVVMTRRMVALDAARAFHQTALAQASVVASSDVAVGLDSLVRYTAIRVREGAAAEGDLLRLQVERDRVATEVSLQEAELARARAALRPYLHDAATGASDLVLDDIIIADDVSGVASRSAASPSPLLLGLRGRISRDTLALTALSARPDVIAARARARAAEADISLQRALTIRQVGATFGSKTTAGSSASMIAGLSIPLPLFDRNRGELQRAQGERTAVEQELRWTERRVLAEVLGAYDAAEILTTRVNALRGDFLSRAEESRRVALAAYREGAVPLLNVLDATRTLADARLLYLRARYAQQDAMLALYVAAGFDPGDALLLSAPTRGSTK